MKNNEFYFVLKTRFRGRNTNLNDPSCQISWPPFKKSFFRRDHLMCFTLSCLPGSHNLNSVCNRFTDTDFNVNELVTWCFGSSTTNSRVESTETITWNKNSKVIKTFNVFTTLIDLFELLERDNVFKTTINSCYNVTLVTMFTCYNVHFIFYLKN